VPGLFLSIETIAGLTTRIVDMDKSLAIILIEEYLRRHLKVKPKRKKSQ